MRARTLTALFSLALPLAVGQPAEAQVPAGVPISSVLSDGQDLLTAQMEVDALIASHQLDRILIVALNSHSPKVEAYCFKQIGTLGRLEQASTLSLLLLNKRIFAPADELPVPGFSLKQESLQDATMKMAYQVLGEQPPPYHGLVDSIEAASLASKLQMLK